jgi:hypothetical protein
MSKRAPPPTRRRGRSAATRPFRVLEWLLPGTLGVFVFMAAFILDTAALMRLFWASATGHFGIVPRAVALVVMLICATPGFLKAYRHLARPAPVPAPMHKQRQRRAAARGEKPTEKSPPLPADSGPARQVRQGEASSDSRADVSTPSKRGRGSKSAKRPAGQLLAQANPRTDQVAGELPLAHGKQAPSRRRSRTTADSRVD